MNSTIYLFGNLGHGLTLYPDDYTKNIFKEFISRASAPTQLIIHRDGAIMNYGYIRKIENGHLFGICVQINGQYFTVVKNLFDVFEDITTNIVVRGDIIQLNNQGNLISAISNLTDKSHEVDRIISYCQTEMAKMSSCCQLLPNIDYSTSDNDINNFRDTDSNQNVVNSSVKNGYTFIYKKDDYDSLALSGYRSTLYFLNKENENNKDQISELKNELDKVKKQKKQFKLVLWLFALFFVFILIVISVISDKNRNIELQVGEINNLTNVNNDYRDSLSSLNYKLNIVKNNYKTKERELKNYKDEVGAVFPIIIDSLKIANTYFNGEIRTDYGGIIFASNSMYLRPRIVYRGLISGSIELKVKFYTPDGKLNVATSAPHGYSYSNEVFVDVGENELYLSGYGNSEEGAWQSGLYTIEVWYNDVCLKHITFRLY